MKRHRLLNYLTRQILQMELPHPIRVAIDGPDAAGKSTVARELAVPLQLHDRSVIRASIDGFHNSRQVRYQQGSASPEGYYYDSFNYQALKQCLLNPLGPHGSGQYRAAVFDYHTDLEVETPLLQAEPDSILLFDGVFLLRPELIQYWDYTIFLEVSLENTLARAEQRDIDLFGSVEDVRKRYQQRYIPGQMIYFHEARPGERATVVVDNNDPENPNILQGLEEQTT